MRIEVTIGKQEPLIFPLNKPKLVIGSHEACDIVIISPNVSRKHLVISSENDQYFVSDQGSTNGSFINEQRLVPGSRAEFTSFFPVRLGTDVLVSLISDEEVKEMGFDLNLSDANSNQVKPQGRDEVTRMISIKDLDKTSTSKLVKNRNKTVEKLKAKVPGSVAKKKKDRRNSIVGFLCISVLLGAGYYHFFILNKTTESQDVTSELNPTQLAKKVEKPLDLGPIKRVSEDDIPKVEEILALKDLPKCSSEIEKFACAHMPNIFEGKWGAVQNEKYVFAISDGAKYKQLAKGFIKEPSLTNGEITKEDQALYDSHVHLMMVVLWVKDHVPEDLQDLKGLQNHQFSIAFINTENDAFELVTAAVFVPESLLRLKREIKAGMFEAAKQNGPETFSFALDYLRFI